MLKIILVLLLTISNVYAQDFKVKYLYNYDGDTITADFDCDIEYFCKNVKIRLYGVDTPEIRTLDKCEKERGQKAKEFVNNRLLNANKIIARHCLKGKYHREICKIIFDGKDLSNELLKSELAIPYYGEGKQFINWCK
jgi:endonuclease YncB( thermonuclease family)